MIDRPHVAWLTAALAILLVAAVAPAAPQSSGAVTLSHADLQELLAPIALYSDPLLATVLGASVYPGEVEAAQKAVKGGADTAAIDASSWQDPVKDLAKVPPALDFLADNREWMTALGEAYVLQSQDVFRAVQELRARAYANGALKTTPEQTVMKEGDTIVVQPASPTVVYVPTYNPQVVYVQDNSSAVAAGVIGFGVGIAVGLALDCDWHHGYCCWGGHYGGYHGRYYGGNADVNINRNTNVNINQNTVNNTVNNVGNSVGREGARWEPDRAKMSPALQEGKATQLDQYRGAGTAGGSAARIPGIQRGSAPIAATPAPRPSTLPNRPSTGGATPTRPEGKPTPRPDAPDRAGGNRAVPAPDRGQGAARPSTPAPGGGNAAKPRVPTPSTPAPRVPSSGAGKQIPKPTNRTGGGAQRGAFDTGGAGRADAAKRGASSRGSAGGSRGGGRPAGGRRR